MKISFLCSCSERGRDGVGDYVARFARALAKRGHRCQIVALNDKYAAEPSASLLDDTTEVVRIPSRHWTKGQLSAAEAALRSFDPDWTSLQMVCYGYEQRGLLLRAPARFERLRIGRRRHLMFHELWIGEAVEHGLK